MATLWVPLSGVGTREWPALHLWSDLRLTFDRLSPADEDSAQWPTGPSSGAIHVLSPQTSGLWWGLPLAGSVYRLIGRCCCIPCPAAAASAVSAVSAATSDIWRRGVSVKRRCECWLRRLSAGTHWRGWSLSADEACQLTRVVVVDWRGWYWLMRVWLVDWAGSVVGLLVVGWGSRGRVIRVSRQLTRKVVIWRGRLSRRVVSWTRMRGWNQMVVRQRPGSWWTLPYLGKSHAAYCACASFVSRRRHWWQRSPLSLVVLFL